MPGYQLPASAIGRELGRGPRLHWATPLTPPTQRAELASALSHVLGRQLPAGAARAKFRRPASC